MNKNNINNEYIKLDSFPYSKLIKHLKNKYGKVNGNYFIDESCMLKNSKIRRFKDEGLYIHHIKEDTGHFLSRTEQAIKFPFEYQKGDNLVYCNLIEHFILHIKIYLKTKGKCGGYGKKMIGNELYNFFNYGKIDTRYAAAYPIISMEKSAFMYYYDKYC